MDSRYPQISFVNKNMSNINLSEKIQEIKDKGFLYIGKGNTFLANGLFAGIHLSEATGEYYSGNGLVGNYSERHYFVPKDSHIVGLNPDKVKLLNQISYKENLYPDIKGYVCLGPGKTFYTGGIYFNGLFLYANNLSGPRVERDDLNGGTDYLIYYVKEGHSLIQQNIEIVNKLNNMNNNQELVIDEDLEKEYKNLREMGYLLIGRNPVPGSASSRGGHIKQNGDIIFSSEIRVGQMNFAIRDSDIIIKNIDTVRKLNPDEDVPDKIQNKIPLWLKNFKEFEQLIKREKDFIHIGWFENINFIEKDVYLAITLPWGYTQSRLMRENSFPEIENSIWAMIHIDEIETIVANIEIIKELNPELDLDFLNNDSNIPNFPFVTPYVPEQNIIDICINDFVYLGKANEIEYHSRFLGFYSEHLEDLKIDIISGRNQYEVCLDKLHGDTHVFAKRESAIARHFHKKNAEFFKQDDYPVIPNNRYINIGKGSLQRDKQIIPHCYILDIENPEKGWNYAEKVPTCGTNLVYAVPKDSDFAKRFEIISTQITQKTINVNPLLHILSFNGVPVNSKEELISHIEPLVLDQSKIQEIAGQIWVSLEYNNPELLVADLAETEPMVAAVIDFHQRPQTAEVSVVTPATGNSPIATMITRAAAGALLSGGLSNHFEFTENGGIRIIQNNPPTLDQANEMILRSMQIKHTGESLDNFSSWALGALIDECQRFFGDDFDMDAMTENTKRAYNTMVTALGVYRKFGNNRFKLSYTHHKEAFYSKLSDEETNWVLQLSEDMGLNALQQRKVISYVRRYGKDSLEETMPETSEELIERLDVKAVNKNYIFLYEGKWHQFRGPFDRIPASARPIINADNLCRCDTSPESPEKLDIWKSEGFIPDPARGREAARVNAEILPVIPPDTDEDTVEYSSSPSDFGGF